MRNHTANPSDGARTALPAPEEIIDWLKRKRRHAIEWSTLSAASAFVGGGIVLALTFGLIFLFVKLWLLILAPTSPAVTAWSIVVTSIIIILFCIDSVRSLRDDMSVIPVWLMRENLYVGPRIIREGIREARRAHGLARLDVLTCANVLSHLATKSFPTTREELRQVFPNLVWPTLIAQLRLVDGVIVFRHDEARVTLTLPLRLELRRLMAPEEPPHAPEPEPQPAPVNEPQSISARDILGVSPTATIAEIKAAYRHRVKECHPDRFASMDERSRQLAEEWTKALNNAYQELLAERLQRSRT